jgi:hypothetical protein
MSFEVFVQCFDDQQPGGVPEEVVRAAFSNFAADSDPDDWHLWYDATNNCRVGVVRLDGHPDMISMLTVHRPCSDSRLWESLYHVLQTNPWVLYFPAERPVLIMGDPAHIRHLPADMREEMGPVEVVRSGQEIVQIIRRS